MIANYFTTTGLPRWQLEIIEKYPDIYLTPNPHLVAWFRESGRAEMFTDPAFCNLRCGFEFDQGWAEMVTDFSKTVSTLVEKLRESQLQPDAWVRANVFKEKIAQLRWQGQDNLVYPFKKILHGYIRSIEHRSLNVCEASGKYGELRNLDGHYKVLSDAEYQKAIKSRKGR